MCAQHTDDILIDMKRRLIILITAVLSVSLFGCGDAIPDLPEDEMKMVEEYAAGLLLKYDAGYKSDMISDEEIQAEKERLEHRAQLTIEAEEARKEREAAKEAAKSSKEGSDSSSEGKASSGRETVYTDINDFFSLGGLNIVSDGVRISDRYPDKSEDSDWQGVVNATGGKKLAVFEFTVSNTGSSPVNLDMSSQKPHFAAEINNSFTKGALTTLLLNDMQTYRKELAAGESEKLVLLFEVPSDVSSVDSADLIMRKGTERGVMQVKAD